MQQSWQSKVLNCLLKIFLKRHVAKIARETSPEKLAQIIQKIRRQADKYTFALPAHAEVSDVYIDHVPAKWVSVGAEKNSRVILYLHGGCYVIGSALAYLDLGYRLAQACKARVLLIDYRLAPEHALPCAREDAMHVYRWLCVSGIVPDDIIMAGDSAGGGLAVSTLVGLRDNGDPLPKAGICISPWTDLAFSGDSATQNSKHDPYIVVPEKLHFLGEIDVRDPIISPLYADLTGLPPLFIQVGGIEVLLDDSRRLAEKARQENVEVDLEIWEGMPHCWHLFAKFLPEGRHAINKIGEFVNAMYG